MAQVAHTGTHTASGRRVLTVSVCAVRSSSGSGGSGGEAVEAVLTAEAHVEPRSTAYVFTGQGSADVGMGMELYASAETD